MSDPSKNLHDIHFELKATADTTSATTTDNSYVCKNGSFLKDKDNDNVKTGSNLIPSNWGQVWDKVSGNYYMMWFDRSHPRHFMGNYCNTNRPNCLTLFNESTNSVGSDSVTPGIGKPLFIVPDTDNVFLFARTVGSPVASDAKLFTGGQYYVKNYVANEGNTKLYQDYAKSSPVGLGSGTTSKAVRLRMTGQETSSGSPVNQRERLQACSQCNTGHAFSPGKQLPKKVCKRWIKVNRARKGHTDDQFALWGRSKPHRKLGKIRYNDGGSSLTDARDHFVPFGVANNKPWYENDVNSNNYRFQPYDDPGYWSNQQVNAKNDYVTRFYKPNSESLKDKPGIITNQNGYNFQLWGWFPLEKNDSNTHKVPLVKVIDCGGSGANSCVNVSKSTTHVRLGNDKTDNTTDQKFVKYNQRSFHTNTRGDATVSADDIYCGYTAGNDNFAGTYTYDEAQKRWRSLFFRNINRYTDSLSITNASSVPPTDTAKLHIETDKIYRYQSDNSIAWNGVRYHGCLKCPPGTKKIPGTSKNGCMRCPVDQWSKGGTNTCSSVSMDYYNNFAMSTCGKSTYNKEGDVFCMDSGQVYGVRNCNAADGNNIETSAQGPRNKQVCTTTEQTYGTSKYSILNKDGTCSVDTSERTYDASDTNTCFKCTCTNGVPAGPKRGKDSTKKSEGCDHEGQHKCQSCNAGYYLDGSKQCQPCTGNMIQPNSGSSTTSCLHCGTGTTANSAHTACIWNQCTCKKRDSSGNLTSQIVGTAATGSYCLTNNGNICQSCNAGYYLDGSKQCQPCPNSPTPKTHTNPTQTGGQSSCNITTTTDWKNYFQGPNGCPTSGPWCITTHDQYEKRDCNAQNGNSITLTSTLKNAKNNHHVCIQGNTAWRSANPTYDYHHGIINGTNCSTIRGWSVKSNNPNNTCFKCTCPNGTPVGPKMGVGASGCDTEGQNKCQSCNTGFHLVDRVGGNTTPRTKAHCASNTGGCKCVPNTCMCKIGGNTVGTPATGTACTSPGGNICTSCNAGYYKDGNECKQCGENKYQVVQNNTGGVGTCTSCGTNEHSPAGSTSSGSCQSNVCRCEVNGATIGTPVPSSSCTQHNRNLCTNCYHNYKLDGTSQCQLCPGGKVRYWGAQGSCQTLPPGSNTATGLLTLYTNILNTSSARGGPDDFTSSGKEVRNWCLNSTDRYKVRKCKLDDGSNIDVSGATKQSVTTNNSNPKQGQYHVCLRKNNSSNFNQSSVRKTRASSGQPVFTLGPSNNIVVTSENSFTLANNSCFKCQCNHGTPAAPKMSLTDKTKGCEYEGKEQCQSCNAGYYLDKTVGSPTYKQCKQCPVNTYQNISNNTSSCTPCGGGKYSPEGSTSSGACKFYCKYNKNNTPDFRITDKTTNTEIQNSYGSSLKETDLYSNKNKYKITFVNNNKYINPKNGKVKVVCDQGDSGKIKLKNTDDTPVSIKSCVIDATRCQTEYVSSGQKECSRYISKGTGYDTALSNYNSTPTAQNYYTLLTKVDKRYTRCSQAKAGYFLGDEVSTNLFNKKTLNLSTSGTNEWTLS